MPDSDRISHPIGGLSPKPAPGGRTLLLILLALGTGFGIKHVLSGGDDSYTGFLRARTTRVVATVSGRLTKITLEEGQTADVGEELIHLTNDELEAEREAGRQKVVNLNFALGRARARAEVDLEWRLRELEAELLETRLQSAEFLKAQFDQRLGAHAWTDLIPESDSPTSVTETSVTETSVTEATTTPDDVFQTAARSDSLLDIDEGQLRALLEQQAATNAAEVSTVQVQLCEDRLLQLTQLISELPEQVDRASGVAALEAELKQAQDELTEIEAKPSAVVLRAAAYGTAGVYRAAVGQRVRAGEPLVELLDRDYRHITVKVPTRELVRFDPQSVVGLEFSGGRRHQGTVSRIPTQADQDTNSVETDESFVTLEIEPLDRVWPDVPIGAAVRVSPCEK